MRQHAIHVLWAVIAALVSASVTADSSEFTITTDKIVAATRFLETNPMDPGSPVLRAAMIQWEDKATEVVDYVCPGVLKPIPDDTVPHSAELLVQFIFGSAAHQLAHPEDKGALVPGQVAGMRSMLKAYAAFLAADPKARIPRLDELASVEAQGRLATYLSPIVLQECEIGS